MHRAGWSIVFAILGVPQFQDYPAATGLTGPAISPKLPAHLDSTVRARLIDAAKERPNFAGHYRSLTWNCGAASISGAVIDLATGEVLALPHIGADNAAFEVCQNARQGSGVEFRVESRLAIVKCGSNFDKRLNRNMPDLDYFVLENQSFKEILRLRGREALARSRGQTNLK
jgi:hypothetical protein